MATTEDFSARLERLERSRAERDFEDEPDEPESSTYQEDIPF